MLAKPLRLRATKDMERVLGGGKKIAYGRVVARVIPNGLEKSRVGIVVSKKVSLKAVERNRVRRCISESVRQRISSLSSGRDVVFIATPALKGAARPEIRSAIIKLLSLIS